MVQIIELPHVGESVVEGTIGQWLKQPGDRVKRYEPLVEVITDKVGRAPRSVGTKQIGCREIRNEKCPVWIDLHSLSANGDGPGFIELSPQWRRPQQRYHAHTHRSQS